MAYRNEAALVDHPVRARPRRIRIIAGAALILLGCAAVWGAFGTRHAEPRMSYPRIAGIGGVFAVDADADMPSPTAVHRLFLDVGNDETAHHGISDHLTKAARILNVYALGGVPPQNVQVAVLFYGKSIPLALSDAAYRRKYGHANPNAALLATLRDAHVKMFACGQTLANDGFTGADVRPGVKVALSALSEREMLQSSGYTYVP